MVVGYALGNRNDLETDIQVLGEDDHNTITYSRSIEINLSQICLNSCSYCSYMRQGNLAVPYTTIKQTKNARSAGAREIVYTANERPDKFPQVKALLELWGFSSYLEYLYTICELGFLEGLIPVVDLGFLTPEEIRELSDVAALIKIPLETEKDFAHEPVFKRKRNKRLPLRIRNLEWAGKLSFPSITGFTVTGNENQSVYSDFLHQIAEIHEKYGTIHDVVLDNYQPSERGVIQGLKPPTKDDMLELVSLAQSILPSDISITVPFAKNRENIADFIKCGIRDLGSIPESKSRVDTTSEWLAEVGSEVEEYGLGLQQRFPLRKSYIKSEMYSKKLGQVFDAYRYKIKKEGQEKLKEARV